MATNPMRSKKFILETKTSTHDVSEALKIFSLESNNKYNMMR